MFTSNPQRSWMMSLFLTSVNSNTRILHGNIKNKRIKRPKLVSFFAERHNLHLIRSWDLGISWLLSVKIFQTLMLSFNLSKGASSSSSVVLYQSELQGQSYTHGILRTHISRMESNRSRASATTTYHTSPTPPKSSGAESTASAAACSSSRSLSSRLRPTGTRPPRRQRGPRRWRRSRAAARTRRPTPAPQLLCLRDLRCGGGSRVCEADVRRSPLPAGDGGRRRPHRVVQERHR